MPFQTIRIFFKPKARSAADNDPEKEKSSKPNLIFTFFPINTLNAIFFTPLFLTN